jgi:hypothetical protein
MILKIRFLYYLYSSKWTSSDPLLFFPPETERKTVSTLEQMEPAKKSKKSREPKKRDRKSFREELCQALADAGSTGEGILHSVIIKNTAFVNLHNSVRTLENRS